MAGAHTGCISKSRHEHVAAESSREVRQPRHQFLAIAQELDPRTSRSNRRNVTAWAVSARTCAANRRNSSLKISARGSGVRAGASVVTAYGQAHGAPRRAPDRDGAPGERGNRFPSIPLEREPEVILPSKLNCSTRTTQAVSPTLAVTLGRSRARSASTVFAPSSER